ncbi:MAG TPA: DivIVA domain-containing protein [Trebonia sp.]|nr:DivIVA domain-containing protein [Trebonia sp.]
MDARPAPGYLDLIERVRNAKFRTTRLPPGYDDAEVDNFLDRIVGILSESGLPDPDELRSAQFTTRRLRPGYLKQDVDGLLAEIAEVVTRL